MCIRDRLVLPIASKSLELPLTTRARMTSMKRFHVVFIESPDKIGDVFIGRSSKCPIEKPKSLETVLHLVHPVKAICSYWVAVVRALQAAEISRGGEVLIADGRLTRCRTVWLQRCWNRRQERLTHFESALTSSTSPPASAQPLKPCLLYTSPSPRDGLLSRMPSSA